MWRRVTLPPTPPALPLLQVSYPRADPGGESGGGGEVPADPGGGGAREVPGGAKGYLVDQRRAELVLERHSQRADGKFLLRPCS